MRLQTDTNLLDGTSNHAVCNTARGTGHVKLRLRQVCPLLTVLGSVLRLKDALNILYHTKLDRDTGTDTNQRKFCTLVKSWEPPFLENIANTPQNAGVVTRGCRLNAHLYDIKRPELAQNILAN